MAEGGDAALDAARLIFGCNLDAIFQYTYPPDGCLWRPFLLRLVATGRSKIHDIPEYHIFREKYMILFAKKTCFRKTPGDLPTVFGIFLLGLLGGSGTAGGRQNHIIL